MKTVILSMSFLIAFLAGTVFLLRERVPADASRVRSVVSVVDGKQVVQILAKGGYSPQKTTAKADMPTVLNIKTNGTFDCSSALVIPSLGIRKNLPPSGDTEVEVPPQPAGTTLEGLCSMGMYHFAVHFE